MCNNLAVESVVNVLILADLHQATDLKVKCIEYISANIDQVQATDGWKLLDTNVTLIKELFVYSAKGH
jgi:speckle-type POZ protein